RCIHQRHEQRDRERNPRACAARVRRGSGVGRRAAAGGSGSGHRSGRPNVGGGGVARKRVAAAWRGGYAERQTGGASAVNAVDGGVSVREVLARARAGGSVTVRGWLRTTRHSKGVSFLELSDGSCFAGLQVVAEPSLANYEGEVASLGTGCAVSITGEVVDSPGKGQRYELRATRVEVVGGVAADYPLQKKRH